MDIFDGKVFFVYGDGISGRAARSAVKKHGGKAKIYTDRNGAFTAPKEMRYDGAVVSPGIRPTHPVYAYCAERGIRLISEVEIGFLLAKGRPTVGVTGTNGKTTVTRLIAEMTGGIACGNIGYPVSRAAMEKKGDCPLVCELSSFQLHSAVISPRVAVITNMASDHIDWHGSEKKYYADKCNIAANMRGGTLVLGEDISVGALDSLKTDANIVRTSSRSVCDGAYISEGYFCFFGERVCPVDYLRLPGEHNIKNALTAIAAAKSLGVGNRAVLDALSSMNPSAHRTEPVGEACGKKWIDDSKGTNVSACLAAIEMTTGSVCLIVGGRGKATDFSELFIGLTERVVNVVAMGETAQDIRDSACKYMPKLKVTVVDNLHDAVQAAAKSKAETVLLSPACASFDEFKNYAERGEKFKREVTALGKCDERK